MPLTVSQRATLTFEKVMPKLKDNFSNNNAICRELKARGNMLESWDGGRFRRESLAYAENGTYTRYRGRQPVNISEVDIVTAARYLVKQISLSLTLDGLESEIENIGKPKLLDVLQTKRMVLEKSFKNNFEEDLASDGTANGGLQLQGLQAHIADNPAVGVVGGIDAADYDWWRPTVYSALTDGGQATSAANIKTYLDRLDIINERGEDTVDFYLADSNYYGFYESFLGGLQEIITKEGGGTYGSGAERLTYKGRSFYHAGGRGGKIAADRVYGINADYMKLVEHPKRKLTPRKPVTSIDQDLEVTLFLWAGCLTCSNRFEQKLLKA